MAANRMGAPCPKCGSQVTDVIMTRSTKDNDKIRRRHCFSCGHRYYTVQPAEMVADRSSIKWIRRNHRCTIDWWDFQEPLKRLQQEEL